MSRTSNYMVDVNVALVRICEAIGLIATLFLFGPSVIGGISEAIAVGVVQSTDDKVHAVTAGVFVILWTITWVIAAAWIRERLSFLAG